MAGHSKWANIQHRKGAQDAKRGQVFTKILREITAAARMGGGDPASNSRLRLAIEKGKDVNMPNDNVTRAIKKGTGELGGAAMEEIRYEGYGPGGVAVIVDCLTDNKVRTVSEVRHAFSKNGGNLGTEGSVAYLFTKKGTLSFDESVNEDTLMEVALEAGADDINGLDVYTTPEHFEAVKIEIAKKIKPARAEISMIPSTTVELDNVDTAQTMLKLIDVLEGLDDVQEVYHNAYVPDEIAEELSQA